MENSSLSEEDAELRLALEDSGRQNRETLICPIGYCAVRAGDVADFVEPGGPTLDDLAPKVPQDCDIAIMIATNDETSTVRETFNGLLLYAGVPDLIFLHKFP